MADDKPAWFRAAIAEGLERLMMLRLDGGPPQDAIVATAAVWVDVLWKMNVGWDQGLDAGRLEQAFAALAEQSQRWPTPAALREVLPAPDWFRATIAEGLQRLTTLRLDGGPPQDAIVATAAVWVDVLWKMNVGWNQGLDAGRLQRAFSVLAGRSQRWPTPAALREVLPARAEQARLPAPPVNAERRAKAHAILGGLRRKMQAAAEEDRRTKAERAARIAAARRATQETLNGSEK